MKNKSFFIFILVSLFIFVSSCDENSETSENMNDSLKLTINKYPDRVKKSIIYEVNVRQYTPEGTFAEFEKHLPRLKELGVEIIWLMPIQPTGVKTEKAH